MKTGPLPLHLKQKVLASMEKNRLSRVATVPANPSAVETSTVTTPPLPTPEMTASPDGANESGLEPSGSMELNLVSPANGLWGASSDFTSESGSYTSNIPDIFETGMDDLEPLATGPWMAMGHLTSEVIVVDHESTAAVPPVAHTGMFPRLGVNTLTETAPPALLFNDQDVRPDWLLSAVKEFLRYIPYYGNLSKVIDQFLLQEARLGYPGLVRYANSSFLLIS